MKEEVDVIVNLILNLFNFKVGVFKVILECVG